VNLAKLVVFLIGVLAVIVLSADTCGSNPAPANNVEQANQEDQQNIYNQGQPLPNFPYSNYRQELIQLEGQLATGKLTTWTIWESYSGVPEGVCKSQGWPIPVTAQLSNPLQASRDPSYTGGAPVGVGQMDPVGIYPPPQGAGTWAFCLDSAGIAHPQYIEGVVDAFSYPVDIVNGKVVQTGQPSDESAIHLCDYNAALKKCV